MITWDLFMYPMLRILEKGETVSARALSDMAADRVNLTDGERLEVVSSGQPRFRNRTGWAQSYLFKVGAVSRPARGKYAITDLGRQLLAAFPDGFGEVDFKQFASERGIPLYQETRTRRKVRRRILLPMSSLMTSNPSTPSSRSRTASNGSTHPSPTNCSPVSTTTTPPSSRKPSSNSSSPWGTAVPRAKPPAPSCPTTAALTGSSTRTPSGSAGSTSRPSATQWTVPSADRTSRPSSEHCREPRPTRVSSSPREVQQGCGAVRRRDPVPRCPHRRRTPLPTDDPLRCRRSGRAHRRNRQIDEDFFE